jgi:hypothetical protein
VIAAERVRTRRKRCAHKAKSEVPPSTRLSQASPPEIRGSDRSRTSQPNHHPASCRPQSPSPSPVALPCQPVVHCSGQQSPFGLRQMPTASSPVRRSPRLTRPVRLAEASRPRLTGPGYRVTIRGKAPAVERTPGPARTPSNAITSSRPVPPRPPLVLVLIPSCAGSNACAFRRRCLVESCTPR